MKKYFLLVIALGLVQFSCKKDNDHDHNDENYHVNIEIEAPIANATVNVNEAMPVIVKFSRGAEEIIHHILIEILDSNNNVVKTIAQEHVHVAGNYTFSNGSAWTPTTAGSYIIKVGSHDMEDHATDPVEANFTVQ